MDRINWDDYFLEIADVVSKRSTCIRRRYGAVIVKDNRIVSTGYNGAPRGQENCSDRGYCEREARQIPPGERYDLCRSVHAEQNAVINGSPADIDGAVLYLAGTNIQDGSVAPGIPCKMCERVLINAKIKKVVGRGGNY